MAQDIVARGMAGRAVWSLGGLAPPVTANSTAAASANAAAIQAALDAAAAITLGYDGPKTTVRLPPNLGVIYIQGALSIGSNTTLDLGGNTLRQAPGAGANLIVTKAYLSAGTAVTLTYTSGTTVSVAWTGHGKSVGDYVCLSGGSPAVFVGCFSVKSVTDANNIVLQLQYLPSTTPSGTWTARSPTRNFDITNGAVDWNIRAGVTGNGLVSMGLVMAYAEGWSVTNLSGCDVPKYVVFAFNVANYSIRDLRCHSNSDGVHVFGPSFNGVVERLSGGFGDDCVAISSRDVHGIYSDVSAGDVINIAVRDINAITTDTTAVCQMYSNVGYAMRGIVFDGALGHGQCAFRIWGDNTDGGQVDDLTIRRINAVGTLFIANYLGNATPLVTVQRLTLEQCGFGGDDNTASVLSMGSAAVVKHMIVRDCHMATPNRTAVFVLGGTFEHIVFQGGRYINISTCKFLKWTQNRGVKKVTFRDVSFETADCVLQLPAGITDAPQIVVQDCRTKSVFDILALSSPCTVDTRGNSFDTTVGAVIHLYNAGASVDLYGGAGDVYSSATMLTIAAGTVNVKSFDRQIDVGATGVNKNAGCYAFNTTLRGAIAANRLAVCNGTNWVDACDQTKTF